MIRAVLLVPAAPWLIPSVAPGLLQEQADLRSRIHDLVAGQSGSAWTVLTAAPSGSDRPTLVGELPGSTLIDPYRVGTGDQVPAAWWVARSVLGDRPAQAIQLPPGAGADERAVALLASLEADGREHLLLVLADGANCHGEHAPGAADEQAVGFDEELHAVLVGGPDTWTRWSADFAARAPEDLLGSTLSAVLPTLGAALADVPLCVSWHGLTTPYGVGHHLVGWDRG